MCYKFMLDNVFSMLTTQKKSSEQAHRIRLQALEVIQDTMVPQGSLSEHFRAVYNDYDDFWLFKRQFAYQLATFCFLSYIFHLRDRNPARISVSRATGNISSSEMGFSFHQSKPIIISVEQVPFRLTPNLQMLLGPIALEGIFSAAILVIAKALAEPEERLEQQLSIFIRDEIIAHCMQFNKRDLNKEFLREHVLQNCELMSHRASALAKPPTSGPLPANQTVIDLVAEAANPSRLAQMDPSWIAFF